MKPVLPLLLLSPLLSNCVMAVRQVAKENHRSETVAQVRKEFPAGTSIATIRTTLTARGYACIDGTEGVALQCDPIKRSGAIFRGNWRLLFMARGDQLESTRAVKSPRPKPPAS